MPTPNASPTEFAFMPLRTSRSLPRQPIAAPDRLVIKRTGEPVQFDLNKITRAISLAVFETRHPNAKNPYRDDFLACFGLAPDDFIAVTRTADRVQTALEGLYYRSGKHPTIEQVQNAVVVQLAADGGWDVANAYMAYRLQQADRRLIVYEGSGMSDYIAQSKYARFNPQLGRREIWPESVARVAGMHRTFFASKLERRLPTNLRASIATLAGPHAATVLSLLGGRTLSQIIEDCFDAVTRKEVLPSMRSLQFGEACLTAQARMFNCSFSNVDRVEFFKEFLYLLLCGCGCGFSVQKQHIARLPSLPKRSLETELPVVHHLVGDTIEGWADALDALIRSYYDGKKIEFSYHLVRPRGADLKTSGGKAPGHLPLKKALTQVEAILALAAGRSLKPIEVYDICMFTARAVLSGGIRRSACICLFSYDDEDMMTAKTGNWFEKHPQRTASNNSAVIPRSMQDDVVFRKLFANTREFGEPGFVFCDHPDGGVNPCSEIGLLPVVNWSLSSAEVEQLYRRGYTGELPGVSRLSGWEMCNLTSTNGALIRSTDDLMCAAIRATVIGTLQAAFTDIPYLGPVTRLINEHDALLGVSICGFMDSPEVLLNPQLLGEAAHVVRATNLLIAELIDINPAARTTTVKPEGTTAALLGTASGIHPNHSRRYFRRVQAARTDPVYRHFKAANPQMCERSVYDPDHTDVITFPIEAPSSAILKKDLGAIEFLDYVRLVQRSWVKAGLNPGCNRAPEISHNVSNTCVIKSNEWDAVADYLWSNRQDFTGVSLFADDGQTRYAQAPFQVVETDEDVLHWNRLQPKPVDYTTLQEHTDNTALKEVIACGGGACELR
jgi:ribonucleoside-diphosphate reductase alpha chain